MTIEDYKKLKWKPWNYIPKALVQKIVLAVDVVSGGEVVTYHTTDAGTHLKAEFDGHKVGFFIEDWD